MDGIKVNLPQKIYVGTDPNAELIQTLPDDKNLYIMTSLELTSSLYAHKSYNF